MQINPDKYPAYQTLIDSLFALNCVGNTGYYEVRVYGLGLVHLDLDGANQTTGSIDEMAIYLEMLYNDGKLDH